MACSFNHRNFGCPNCDANLGALQEEVVVLRACHESAERENRKHREAYCGPEREAYNEAVIRIDPAAIGEHFLAGGTRIMLALESRAIAAEAVVSAATALIREIQKRDSEGNTIPEHTYSRLANLIRAAGGQV